ncbi:unnamed protein product [Cylindrotheca closterium]|uniref:Uncharacterized protein n=1 Tax=Cylindrotheca closterium TaxID=2856 RepID=A0AAD2JP37_9STRA|nr:unnamed protein product [Cylindrotheca closterium]
MGGAGMTIPVSSQSQIFRKHFNMSCNLPSNNHDRETNSSLLQGTAPHDDDEAVFQMTTPRTATELVDESIAIINETEDLDGINTYICDGDYTPDQLNGGDNRNGDLPKQ